MGRKRSLNMDALITSHRHLVYQRFGRDACMDFLTNGCKRSQSHCRFLHVPLDIICPNNGSCPDGKHCKFRHPDLSLPPPTPTVSPIRANNKKNETSNILDVVRRQEKKNKEKEYTIRPLSPNDFPELPKTTTIDTKHIPTPAPSPTSSSSPSNVSEDDGDGDLDLSVLDAEIFREQEEEEEPSRIQLNTFTCTVEDQRMMRSHIPVILPFQKFPPLVILPS